MRSLGFEVKKADVLKILKDYDNQGTGKILFQDYSEVGKLSEKVTNIWKDVKVYVQTGVLVSTCYP